MRRRARPSHSISTAWMCVMVGTSAMVCLVMVLVVLPAWLVRPDAPVTAAERLKAENDIRATLVQLLGGTALLSGVYLSGRTLRASWDSQITERFSRSIDQLGSESIDTRLGAIYALERIAHSSRQDHGPVMEVLSAFLREHRRWEPADEPVEADGPAIGRPGLRSDYQAALTVLARRRQEHDDRCSAGVDLDGTDLRGCDLRNAHLAGASFLAAHLEEANLSGAHLAGAAFDFAHLERAWLEDADLQGASLFRAHLNEANLRGANLKGAGMERANLEGADLRTTVGVAPEQLRHAGTDDATILPRKASR